MHLRPIGLRAPSEKVLRGGCDALGIRKENFRTIALQDNSMLSLTARSHLELVTARTVRVVTCRESEFSYSCVFLVESHVWSELHILVSG